MTRVHFMKRSERRRQKKNKSRATNIKKKLAVTRGKERTKNKIEKEVDFVEKRAYADYNRKYVTIRNPKDE